MTTIKLKTKLVQPHFALTMKQEQKNVIDYILDELKGIDYVNLKHDPEFIKYLAEIIENQVKKKDDPSIVKPSKMDVFVEIMKRLFPHITEESMEASKGTVEFLLKNKLVKKVGLKKIMRYYLKKRFSLC